jgi:4-hydroxy-tetrahydrodipicolinate synthase
MAEDKPYLIAAVGTPLDADEKLHATGLRAHLEDQLAGGMDGVLVAGSMGVMQLLTDEVYRDLLRQSVECIDGRCEVLVGIGDTSFVRTRARLQFVNELQVDGAVALAPFFMQFSQDELVDYFWSLADESRAPLFLYDLPQRTGTTLDVETVLRLREHANIAGIKCSGDVTLARVLAAAVAGTGFRLIFAQPQLVDVLLRSGLMEQLDGVYAVFPNWVKRLKAALAAADWQAAGKLCQLMSKVFPVLLKHNVMPAMTAILNARSIPGNFAPRPYRTLPPDEVEAIVNDPAVRALST